MLEMATRYTRAPPPTKPRAAKAKKAAKKEGAEEEEDQAEEEEEVITLSALLRMPTYPSQGGYTPLLAAVSYGQLEVCKAGLFAHSSTTHHLIVTYSLSTRHIYSLIAHHLLITCSSPQ